MKNKKKTVTIIAIIGIGLAIIGGIGFYTCCTDNGISKSFGSKSFSNSRCAL